MATLTYNNNPHLTWYRFDCYEYAVMNKNVGQHDINLLVTGTDYEFDATIQYNETTTFTLPADGVYDIVVTLLDGSETVPTVYEDILVDFCGLTLCWLKLLKQLYCNNCIGSDVGDPCEELCKDRALFGTNGGNFDKDTLRNGLRQLQAMFLAYMAHVYEYNLGYTDLEVPPAQRAAKAAQVKKMWAQIKKFIQSCGFDCNSGAEGLSTPCKNC